jgi:nucleoside-diphosphate-sugar epimerase
MKVLVTGAAGFIGANVIRELLATGHEVVATVRPGARAERLDKVRDRCTVVEHDVGDSSRTRTLFRRHAPDVVIHLAWYAEPGGYRYALAENVASLSATADLLLAAADRGCRVVLGGTCVEHLVNADRPIYDAAKLAAHRLAEGFAAAGVLVTCGHVFYLYGPFEDERRVVPSVIRSILAGQPIATTTGTQTRDYLHVADVAAAFVALTVAPVAGGVDIASGTVVTLADVVHLIGAETGRPDLIRLGELGPAVDNGYEAAGIPGALHALGWRQRYDLRSGIRQTINWWIARQEIRT